MASDEEWYRFVLRGLRLGHMDTVVEADICRDHNRTVVPDGATGIPKLKRLPCGSIVELQRCISDLVLMSAYFRRLWGDSSLLLSISRLGLIVLVEGETLETDSEDMESAFNLVRIAPACESFVALA